MRHEEQDFLGATEDEVIESLQEDVRHWARRAKELEKALAHYKNCRHACIDCFCTVEARAALNG